MVLVLTGNVYIFLNNLTLLILTFVMVTGLVEITIPLESILRVVIFQMALREMGCAQ